MEFVRLGAAHCDARCLVIDMVIEVLWSKLWVADGALTSFLDHLLGLGVNGLRDLKLKRKSNDIYSSYMICRQQDLGQWQVILPEFFKENWKN